MKVDMLMSLVFALSEQETWSTRYKYEWHTCNQPTHPNPTDPDPSTTSATPTPAAASTFSLTIIQLSPQKKFINKYRLFKQRPLPWLSYLVPISSSVLHEAKNCLAFFSISCQEGKDW